MIFTKWKHAQSVKVGVDHIENELPCQDNVYYLNGKGIHVMALSDGAGSKKYSQIGSATVTKSACEYLIDNFDTLLTISETYNKSEEEQNESNKLLKNSLFNYLKKDLLDKVVEGKIQFDDLACTLLFVAMKGDKYILGHLGDGVIGGLFNSGKGEALKVLSHPENGDQINITFFMTDQDAEEHLRIKTGRFANLRGLILMSDGPEEVLYHPINGLHQNCLKLFKNYDNYPEQIYNKILEKFLSAQVAKYSYDDLSLNILYLTEVNSKECSIEVLDDLFVDITNKKQTIQRSSYGLFLDNSVKYATKENMESIKRK